MKKIKHDKRCQDICGIVKQIFEINGGLSWEDQLQRQI